MDNIFGMDVSQPVGHLPQSFNLGRHFTGKLFITVNVIVDSPNANFQYQIPTNIE
jgi:hypothetical protein